MILALTGWATESWHVVTSRAVLAGLVNNDVPRLGALDPVVFLSFIEGVVCESEDAAKLIQEMYDAAAPRPPAPPVTRGDDRRREIARFMSV